MHTSKIILPTKFSISKESLNLDINQEDSCLGNVKTKAEESGWDDQDLRIREIWELARQSGECQQPKKRCLLPKVIQTRANRCRPAGGHPVAGGVQCLGLQELAYKACDSERESSRTGCHFWGKVKREKEAGSLSNGSQMYTFNSLTGSQHDSRTAERLRQELVKILEYFGGKKDHQCVHTSF